MNWLQDAFQRGVKAKETKEEDKIQKDLEAKESVERKKQASAKAMIEFKKYSPEIEAVLAEFKKVFPTSVITYWEGSFEGGYGLRDIKAVPLSSSTYQAGGTVGEDDKSTFSRFYSQGIGWDIVVESLSLTTGFGLVLGGGYKPFLFTYFKDNKDYKYYSHYTVRSLKEWLAKEVENAAMAN